MALGLKTSVAKALQIQAVDFADSSITAGKINFNCAAGVAGSYKIARGNYVVDGTATDTSGLTSIVEMVAINKSKTAANVNYSPVVSAIASGTDLFISCWKYTAADDTTVVAASSEATVSWISVGT